MDKKIAQKLFYPHSEIYKNRKHIHDSVELRKDSLNIFPRIRKNR